MAQIYYHNPRCSKSRQGLELLENNNVEPTVKLYLKEGVTSAEFKDLVKKTNKQPLEGLIRVKEARFKELELKGKELSVDEWADIVSENPVLLERPIYVNGSKARVGRPPEDLLEIL
jgi:arsenate reductase